MTKWEKTKRFFVNGWIEWNLWLDSTDGWNAFAAGVAAGFALFALGVVVS